MKRKLLHFFINLIIITFNSDCISQVLFPPFDSIEVKLINADSVFFFSDNFAVTASGQNISNISITDNQVSGDNLPPSLKIRNLQGIIIYSKKAKFSTIPMIVGRQNKSISTPEMIRKFLINMDSYKGQSEKGGIRIHVWEKNSRAENYLISLNNGKVIGNDLTQSNSKTKNYHSVFNRQLKDIVIEAAGIWIDPPKMGNNFISSEILRLLQKGPLLVEYWDGFGWKFFEQAYLGDESPELEGHIQMAYALFPPVTKKNYPAMLTGGINLDMASQNIFHELDRLGNNILILEGDQSIIPTSSQMRLHEGISPEDTDLKIYQSAATAVSDSNVNFLFLHYHGLDELNHSYGPYDAKTLSHFRNLWKWHAELAKQWSGNMLIISDHGVHLIDNREVTNISENYTTKGTHGDFIFEDMAVPFIEQKGKGKRTIHPVLTENQAEKIWDNIGNPILAKQENKSNNEILEIIIHNTHLYFHKNKDQYLFNKNYHYSYLKKGQVLENDVQGEILIALMKDYDLGNIQQVIAYSYDGRQVVFSNEELTNKKLFIALNPVSNKPEVAFTLFPMQDKFPNRIVKQLKRIELQ